MSYENHTTTECRKQEAGCQFSGNSAQKFQPQSVSYDTAALKSLMDRGGVLIPLQPIGHPDEKTPLKGRSWRRRPYTLTEILFHVQIGGLVGLVTGSLGFAVLDVDQGDPLLLVQQVKPALAAPSCKAGRMHLYFHDPAATRASRDGFKHPAGNGRWQWEPGPGRPRLSGEVRSGNGYVALYGGTDTHLAAFLDTGTTAGPSSSAPSPFFLSSPFPMAILDQPQQGIPKAQARRKVAASGLKDDNQISRPERVAALAGAVAGGGATATTSGPVENRRRAPEDLPQPEDTEEGWRNDTLFDYVRYYAAGLDIEDGDWGARKLYAQVRAFALAIRARMPEPEPMEKVLATCNSICRYYLDGGRMEGHGENFTHEQRQYGGYNKARNIRLANEEWDLEVWELWLTGESIRKLASTGRYGSRGRIENVIRRYRSYYPGAAERRGTGDVPVHWSADAPLTSESEPEPVAAEPVEEGLKEAVREANVAARHLRHWLDEHAGEPTFAADWSAWWGDVQRPKRDPPT